MTQRAFSFMGYENNLPAPAEKQSSISAAYLKVILKAIEDAPSTQYAVFSCDSEYTALKGAHYLRQVLGKGYKVSARGSFIYGAKS